MQTRKILGLDLGVGSVGWALIETEDDQPKSILAMGSRIVPLSSDDSTKFQKGQAITKNAERTQKRTMRKGLNRYQIRRALLTDLLRRNGMLPEYMNENVIDLWQLRSDAATEGKQLSLPQIGRVLYHINQKRGYKHSKADISADAKQTKYVEAVNQRYRNIQALHQTIGQYFCQQLKETAVQTEKGVYYTFRIKEKVLPRAAYVAEFDQIMKVQQSYYPNVLTDELIDTLRNHIIFYQRPLKSCKHLVGLCEFEMRPYKRNDGQIVYGGPKCAPRTSPLAQLCAVWEAVNNITLTNRSNETLEITPKQRKAMADFLYEHEKMGVKDLQKILGISPKDGWWAGKAIGKGIKGNTTYTQLRDALGPISNAADLLSMKIELTDSMVDTTTAELIRQVSPNVEEQPLYRLWHIVYSAQNEDDLRKALHKQFDIEDEKVVANLGKIDFVKPGYANKSNKFMRKLLPYLMQGYKYNEACAHIGVNHSNSLTAEQNTVRPLLDKIPLLEKNALRQPVIEKILNQMINVVNALKAEFGDIDDVRIELARELKESKDERESAFKRNNENERKNKEYEARIREYGIRPSRSRIQKYKMWEESQKKCFYCGKTIDVVEFLNGVDAEIEHIIPQSVLFDDSFSNKLCSCRDCNHTKGNLTAREFMEQHSAADYEAYLRRVDEAFDEHRISKTKRDHLLWRKEDIPQDFIDRQLRQSQYIAKKAAEILRQGVRNVYATSGSVTDFLRHQWGYDNILHYLNLPRYQQVDGLTESVTYDHCGQKHQEERIKDWTKRLDHRHHAIDALTIALTQQSVIQRLNTLNASREEMKNDLGQRIDTPEYTEKRSLLEKWVDIQPHFSVQEVTDKVDGILISFRAGKRVATPAKRAIYQQRKRCIVQTGLQVPRGALSEETVYGKLGNKYVVKYALTHPSMKVDDIVDPTIREIVRNRLNAFGGNVKDAFAESLYSDVAHKMQIKSVRCYTNLQDKAVSAVRFNAQGEPVGFVKMGNNHHIAIYCDKKGQYQESVVSFWHAVERKRYGIPVVIEKPQEVWDKLIDIDAIPQDFLENLPKDDWQFVVSLQQNEMFILGMDEADYEAAMEQKDYRTLNKYLYRVQKISSKEYYFRYHTETSVDDKYEGKNNPNISIELQKLKRIKSFGALFSQHPHKVRINLLGEISAL